MVCLWVLPARSGICYVATGNNLTLFGVLCSQYFEKKAIVLRKTANEYFLYLFAPWDYPHTEFARNGQSQLPSTYATGPI